jgi:protein O-mannosyl-transferase
VAKRKSKRGNRLAPERVAPAPAAGSSPDAIALRRTTWAHFLLLLFVAFAVYGLALRNGFVTDDNLQILRNPLVKDAHHLPELFSGDVWSFAEPGSTNYYRPFQLLAYVGEYLTFGERPWAWHLVNLMLNGAFICATYFLLRAMGGAELAFWSALFFALQPMHVEPVVWIAALTDLQCGFFLVAAMLFYHRAQSGTQPVWSSTFSAILFGAALLTKETALLFPVILLAYEVLFRRNDLRPLWRRALWILPQLAVLEGYIIVRLVALGAFAPALQENPAQLTPVQLVLAIPPVLARYLGKLLVPVRMNYFYWFTPPTTLGWGSLGGFALVACLATAMWLLRKSQPLLAFALAWFFLTLAPALSLNTVGANFFTERYLYIPSLGFCVLAAWAWLWLRQRVPPGPARWATWGALALVLIFYVVQIERRIPVFHDNLTLFSATIRQSPDAPKVQAGLASAYYDRGDVDHALEHGFRAVALQPDYEIARINLAQYLSDKGRYDEAIGQLRQAIQLRPQYLAPWINLAKMYVDKGDWTQAAACYRRLAALDPARSEYYGQLIAATEIGGRTEAAIAQFRGAAARDPHDVGVLVQLGDAYARLARWKEAVDTFRLASEQEPKNALVLNKLGVSLEQIGDSAGALSVYQRAVQWQPDFHLARLDFALALASAGRLDESTAQLLIILQKDPRWEHADQVHFALGSNDEKKNDFSAAASQFEQVLALNPDYGEARQHLQELRARPGPTH